MKRTHRQLLKDTKALWNGAIRAYGEGEDTDAEYDASVAVHHLRLAIKAKAVEETKEQKK